MAGTGQSCEDLVIKKIIIGGENGAQGPAGPPGPGVTFPIAASNISVTNTGYNNLQEVLDYLLYVPLNINSFTTPVTLFEKRGSTDPSADFTMNFTWSINRVITGGSQTLTGPGAMTPVSLTTAERSKLVTLTDFNTTSTFSLITTDSAGATDTAARQITFANRIYYGDAVIPGSINSAFIQSLSNKLQTTFVTNVNSNTLASDNPKKYFWFAYPVAYGTPTLMVGAFPLDTQAPVLVSFTNTLGHTENYNVVRATNHSLGSIFIDIT
jgi:hypothetical protein